MRKQSKGRGQQEGNHCDHGYTVEEDGDVIMDLEQMDEQDTRVSHCMPLVVTNAPKMKKVSG